MAPWIFASQLLLIALLNVHCFPAKKEWRQHNPKEVDSDQRIGLRYSSPPAAPTMPTDLDHPAVSSYYEPVEKEYSIDPYPASFSSPPLAFSGVTNWSPVEKSTYTVSRTSPLGPDSGLLPPPPMYQPGELEHFEENIEHGNSERESEELSLMPPPYPEPFYQPGEFYEYSAIIDHGNSEQETEDEGFMPPPYAAFTSESSSDIQLVPQHLLSFGQNHYYLFMTGQLPPGTLSHFRMDNEKGADDWNEVHYERYHYPSAQSPTQAQMQLQQPPQKSKV